ncbi:zinc finger BED domain-containing protein 1-like [Sinocyclocheilus grahami]|uniref:zinc finger BED domain-containing protein 1-like n=1 Tax=Sinocyclocheilus grahami TaxID=75366 RepID=UPI0007AC6B2E|nr:PREDICTED: zinc finger BED domain-containing protein 1-like [Sinocyclocheilus grahami]
MEDKYSAPATQQLLAKATLIDPRYRDINPGDDVKDVLLEEMLAMPDERSDGGDGEGAMRTSAAGEGEGSAPSPPEKKKNFADLLGKRKAQSSNPVPKRIRADTEVARYLQEEALDLHSDPLAWWRDNQARLLLLSKVARKYMTICATSAPSERVFSAEGNIVTPLRSSLKPDKVNMLVFLARNSKTEK